MCFKFSVLALVCLSGIAVAHRAPQKDKRQVGSAIAEKDDHLQAESQPNAAVQGGSKYFQYIHVPAKDHYEHGHKRGNEHHFIERHEKGHPHAGEFKTKVRWGDKHGGYGEHYWDYNHAGHGHDGDSEGSDNHEEYTYYEEGEETKNVPVTLEKIQREKRQPQDVEFINDNARTLYLEEGMKQKHGGNYRKAKDVRGKRAHSAEKINGYDLEFDPESGKIVNKQTGKSYTLLPDF